MGDFLWTPGMVMKGMKMIVSKKALKNLGLATGLTMLMTGCLSNKFAAPMQLGGKWVSADTLNLGYDVYQNNCMQCHGQKGDGIGPAAQGQNPPPRNFQQGIFKFQTTAAGDLP